MGTTGTSLRGPGLASEEFMKSKSVLMIMALWGCIASAVAQREYRVDDVPYVITSADFNRDGTVDLATIHPASVCLLFGQGDGRFSQPALCFATEGEMAFPPAIVAGDFNLDGIPDLATTNSSDHNITIRLGNGDGTFKAIGPYSVARAPRYVVTADFNLDGLPDVATVSQSSMSVSVLRGNGDGTLTPAPVRDYGVADNPVELAVGDFNVDGCPDLISTNFGVNPRYGNTLSLLLGQCDATFQEARNFTVGMGPRAAATGDFNGDACPDLAFTNQVDHTVGTLLGDCQGDFPMQLTIAVCAPDYFTPFTIAATELNDDGRTDLVITCRFSTTHQGSDSILIGAGDGTFQRGGQYPSGRHPHGVVVADFNGDNRKDLATTHHDYPGIVTVLLGDGQGGFSPPGGTE